MEEGFVPDRGDHSRVVPSLWVQGAPEKSFFTGVKLRGKQKHEVTVYRCPRCGLMKLYARPAE
jgi:hypothetical protein